MTDAFSSWWTSGYPDSPGGQLALASPLAERAREAFEAGAARERQRIRDGIERACWQRYVIPQWLADLVKEGSDAT